MDRLWLGEVEVDGEPGSANVDQRGLNKPRALAVGPELVDTRLDARYPVWTTRSGSCAYA